MRLARATISETEPQKRRLEIQARTVKDFCRVYGVGKTVAYQLIDQGKVLGVKVGRRTLIDEASARKWYESLPRAMSPKKPNLANALSNSDFVWGAEAIGRVIARTRVQVYHLHAAGKLDGAVRKFGAKTLVGSRAALAELLPGAGRAPEQS